jgi:hypothetical protein
MAATLHKKRKETGSGESPAARCSRALRCRNKKSGSEEPLVA